MLSKTKKPYVIYMAEIIYSYVSIIKKKDLNMKTKDAINKFMETPQFEKLSDGTLHEEWFAELKKNDYKIITPLHNLQIKSVNKTIKHVKMGNIKLAEKSIKPAINYLIKQKCKKIILGCTELPIAIFAFKSLKNAKISKLYLDPNLILANSSMRKYRK